MVLVVSHTVVAHGEPNKAWGRLANKDLELVTAAGGCPKWCRDAEMQRCRDAEMATAIAGG